MIKENKVEFIAEKEDRLDKAASDYVRRTVFSFPDTQIFLNGKKVKKSAKVKKGDEVSILYKEDIFEGLEAEDIKLDILYEDDSILVINKAQGMVVHPGAGVSCGTVANALLSMYGEDFLSDGDDTRPGIVHRLDKDTSGVLIIAKTEDALSFLSAEFKERRTEKYYIALARGFFKDQHGFVEKNIVRDRKDRKKFTTSDDEDKGRSAKTEYFVLFQAKDYAFLKIRIYTGRTHQIRVHLKSINHPIIGDEIYSSDRNIPLMLHSYALFIHHPVTNEMMSFKAEIPERFKPYLAEYGEIRL